MDDITKSLVVGLLTVTIMFGLVSIVFIAEGLPPVPLYAALFLDVTAALMVALTWLFRDL